MPGRFFDEWQIGDKVAHAVTRTVTETDNVLISALTHNPQPMHLDQEVAAKSEFGQPIVNSIYTFGLMVGVSVADTTLGTLDRQSRLRQIACSPIRCSSATPCAAKPNASRSAKASRGPMPDRHLGAPQLQPAR